MGRLSSILLIIFLMGFLEIVPSIDARKVKNNLENKKKTFKLLVPELEDSLILNSLPKGTKPLNSSPSMKGYSVVFHRKLRNNNNNNNMAIKKKKKTLKLEASLILNALPKGSRPPNSAPSKKGHSVVLDRKLFTTAIHHHQPRPSTTKIRILQSVPSPGIGH